MTTERPSHLWLVEVGNSTPPLFAVLKAWFDPGSDEMAEHLIESRCCPHDFLGVEALISGDDIDPHGALRFVQQIETPADWEFIGQVDYDRYRAAFDKLPPIPQASVGSPLERAARALVVELDRQENGGNFNPADVKFEEGLILGYIDQNSVDIGGLARAVLTAVREPSEAMKAKGAEVLMQWQDSDDPYLTNAATSALHAMIDAALEEG